MKKNNTQKIVFGAMMIALFTLIIVFDTFTGQMFNVFFYYLMPIPLVVYGVRYDLTGQLLVGFCCGIMSFMFGLPETILFVISAVISSLVISYGIHKKYSGVVVYMLTSAITVLGQILSITLLAKIIGYDVASEVAEIANILKGFNIGDITKIYVMACALMGFMESYLMIFFANFVLHRLKLPIVPRISILLLHLPKWMGLLCIAGLCTRKVEFASISFILLIIQGFSFMLLYGLSKDIKPIVRVLLLVGCLIPVVNYLYMGVGLFDIFSEKRKEIMYNIGL